jgi:hypothetical protein
MTKKDEQVLLVFERKIFRRICGPKCENGEWKSRTNRELEKMSKGENTVKWIKGQRILRTHSRPAGRNGDVRTGRNQRIVF